jgi:hypothetical protein
LDLKTNIRKYYRYVFKNDGFAFRPQRESITPHAFETARTIRGAHRPPSIIVHGIMKRSGTVFTGELLGLHPDIQQHPNLIWETPFLTLTGDVKKLQKDFFLLYQQNVGKIGENDFLPLFGASFIAYLYAMIPTEKRMLLKVPGVEYLDYFYDVFPHENLLLLTRDGRDLVASTIKTWPQLRFVDVCRRWANSANMILRFRDTHKDRPGYWLARYEDAVHAPETFVREACCHLNLDPNTYPFEKMNTLPVIGSSTTRKQGETWMKKTQGFNPIGRWQQWSGWKKKTFKRIAGQALIELGYCENLDW